LCSHEQSVNMPIRDPADINVSLKLTASDREGTKESKQQAKH